MNATMIDGRAILKAMPAAARHAVWVVAMDEAANARLTAVGCPPIKTAKQHVRLAGLAMLGLSAEERQAVLEAARS